MRKLDVSQLTPDMILAVDVYTHDDQLLLPRGHVLNDKSITRLLMCSIPFTYVEDEPNPIYDTIDEQSYSARLRETEEFKRFSSDFQEEVAHFKSALNDVVEKNAPLNINELLKDTLSLLDQARGGIHIFDMLHSMRQFDDLTFTHGMNVALICNVMAGWLNLSEEDTLLVTQCGLLHDIGKLKIPENIIKKPAKLTDEEYNIIRKHPIEGYQILRGIGVNPHIANAALMHHERCDGTGYPLGLKADKIDRFAKMVAIADVYDAMTSARVYRGPLCPFKVIEIFESEGLQKYDSQYITTFLQNVLHTYISNTIRLSDGREGMVIFINNQALSRPLVRCGETYVDLSKEPSSLFIQEII